MIFAATALLAGCASTPSARRPEASPTPRPIAAPPLATPRPTVAADPVIGRTAASLIATFGPPALDVREGVARKLQFAGPTCVLDAYLYPPRPQIEPVATHVDARLPDGRDTDRAACVAALRRP